MGDPISEETTIRGFLFSQLTSHDKLKHLTRKRCIKCRKPMGHGYWIVNLPLPELLRIIAVYLETGLKVQMICCKCANRINESYDGKSKGIRIITQNTGRRRVA